ncbi:uncharacterized protein PAC_14187 [Phialocephala subalpina]|uniref:Fungal N-terminal domain-containing protein n=1 Tax=Phialocephala subalpina TaxID=576137 RepID=A0A1L7XGW7_9HELO|nr:uncharacterized protein PAC_14187 [Phialocephala subalpina]
MDPLTILSLAGNIIQFGSFGAKLMFRTKHFYNSTTGTGPAFASDELALVTGDLQAIILRFRQYVPASLLGTLTAGYARTLEGNFHKTCEDAAGVAKDLLDLTGKLKLKTREVHCLQFDLRATSSKPEIKALQKWLKGLKVALGPVLFALSENTQSRLSPTLTEFRKSGCP